jgi:hypothetical protein
MCGTPNLGAPFGNIDDARVVFNALTDVAMNYVPALIPFATVPLILLKGSRRLTPALEQMHPSSAFMALLNASDDPGVRYTILAGDVDQYCESPDPLSAHRHIACHHLNYFMSEAGHAALSAVEW